MHKLVLIRHGQSEWNQKKLFCGWTDVDLTEKGIAEAKAAAKLLTEAGYKFDIAFTSLLKRAIHTLDLVLEGMNQTDIPIVKSWRLNERMYGALQGLSKPDTREKYGEKQFMLWRRSYATPPPALTKDDERYPGKLDIFSGMDEKDIPLTECLKDVVNRFQPFWDSDIAPALTGGKRVIIAAHGNSLRALVKFLDNISEEDIVGLNIPTGLPLVYELDDNLKPIKHYYLGDAEAAQKAIEADKNMGK